MIPKLLTIKGLYSYQTEQTIDFAQLTQSNLFGIFGNVGAGKSSILEAIMLALYGEVERLGTSGRNYNILNLRSDDLLIVFDFEIEGKLYRSKVSGSRNSKKFNDVKVKPPAFFEQVDGEFKPIDIKTAEPLIGLKPDDFKKTIIIPQGTFQDFLQLGDTERARMMRELFGLERYELEPKVKILLIQNDATIQGLKGQLTQIGDIKSEDIEAKKTQLTDLQTYINEQQIELGKNRTLESDLKQLKSDFEQWQQNQKRFEELAAGEAHFSNLQKQMEDYEMAFLTFKNLFDNRKKLTSDLSKNESELEKKRQKFIENGGILEKLNVSKQNLTPQYEQRENLKKQAEEARKMVSIQVAEAEMNEQQKKLDMGHTYLNDKNISIEKYKIAVADIEKQRLSLRANQPNLNELNAVKDWFSDSFTIKKEITRLKNEQKGLEEKLAGIEQSKSFIIRNDLPSLNISLSIDTKIPEIIAEVKSKIVHVKKDIEQILHEQLHLKASEKLESLASDLAEGEACPLCGATHHPSLMKISEVRFTLKSLDVRLAKHKKEMQTLENIENQLITLNINFNNEIFTRQNIDSRLVDENQKTDAHNQKFTWQSFSQNDFGAVEKAIRAAADFDNTMRKLEDDLTKAYKNKENTEGDIEKYRNRISQLQVLIATQQSTIQVLEKQIEVLDAVVWRLKSASELTELAENLEKQYITIDSEYQYLDKQIQNAQSEGQILRGSMDTLIQAQNTLEAAQMSLISELNDKLRATHFKDFEAIERILATNLNITEERQKLNDFKNQKLLISARLSELNEKLKGQKYNAENHQALIIDIQNIEKNIQTHNQVIGELNRDIKDMSHRLKQRQETEKALTEKEHRGENLKILRGLFQRSGFVNYASSVFLQSIINAANERFEKLTNGQLRLQITESNSFIVCDMLNGGQLRDVRTLSGGQTFQASLCLALALSDHIQSRHQARQNFFFLDEGFGSLDSDSLQKVFEALKALQKENRIVGVISHVETMRSEIDRYLQVTLSDVDGSQVKLY